MKQLVSLFAAAVVLLSAVPCWAQMAQAGPGGPMPGMMRPAGPGPPAAGGMQGMCPVCGRQMPGPKPDMGPMGARMSPEQTLGICLRDLKLSPDQIVEIRGIILDFRKTQIRLTADVEIGQIDLQQMLLQEEVDPKKLEGQVVAINELQGELQLEGMRALLAARDVLTPEQRMELLSRMRMGAGPPARPGGPRGPMPVGPGRPVPPSGPSPMPSPTPPR